MTPYRCSRGLDRPSCSLAEQRVCGMDVLTDRQRFSIAAMQSMHRSNSRDLALTLQGDLIDDYEETLLAVYLVTGHDILIARMVDPSAALAEFPLPVPQPGTGAGASPPCFTPSRAFFCASCVEHQLVGDVVLVDVAHVGRGLDADLLGGDELDVVEPRWGRARASPPPCACWRCWPGRRCSSRRRTACGWSRRTSRRRSIWSSAGPCTSCRRGCSAR